MMKIIKYLVLGLVLATFSSHSFSQCGNCDWYGSNYPGCCNQDSGWGWENNQSCVGQNTCQGSGRNFTGGGGGCGTASNGYPKCCDAGSDPDGDGWGWENNQSCRVEGGSGSSSSSSGGSSSSSGGSGCGTASNGYPRCCNASSDPDGDGWGWENNQSCRVEGGNGGGGSSSSSGGGGGSCSNSGSCPSVSCPSGMSCGCEIVGGLGANKRAYRNAGANRSFLASAMMETRQMNTNYPYGDNKTGDAFNAGATKQNWGMTRQCHAAWNGLGSGSYATSAAMNNNKSLDVQVYNECRNHFGNNWFAGHRNGSSGLSNPNTQDIQNFKRAYEWTYDRLAGHECDDVRFWVNVPAI